MNEKKRFQHVAVLKGGFSQEREVSLRSGAAVARGLRTGGYEVEEVDVQNRIIELPKHSEAVFVALHGAFGEDGGVQDFLEKKGIPYTGSDPDASRLAFDKHASKLCLKAAGVPTPAWEFLDKGGERSLSLPVVVKPQSQGSSFGVHRVFTEAAWAPAIADALSYGGRALVEVFIEGQELTVGILGDQALPVIEIRAPNGDYNYSAKYTSGVTEYLVPAPMDESASQLVRDVAMATYRALGGRGFGRVDLRRNAKGEVFVLELNTIPGFTETSLLPKAAAAAGMDFSELCCRIMESAMV